MPRHDFDISMTPGSEVSQMTSCLVISEELYYNSEMDCPVPMSVSQMQKEHYQVHSIPDAQQQKGCYAKAGKSHRTAGRYRGMTGLGTIEVNIGQITGWMYGWDAC